MLRLTKTIIPHVGLPGKTVGDLDKTMRLQYALEHANEYRFTYYNERGNETMNSSELVRGILYAFRQYADASLLENGTTLRRNADDFRSPTDAEMEEGRAKFRTHLNFERTSNIRFGS